MQLRRLERRDLVQIRNLWKTCFGDSDAFLDVYFQSAARAEDGLGVFQGNKLVSELFEIPMRVCIGGRVYSCMFIAGCATLPEARNQHLMRTLIHEALVGLRSRRICASFLHPFQHAFYRRFGYETVSYVHEHSAEPCAGDTSAMIVSRLQELPEAALYAAYRKFAQQYANFFMRSRERMRAWLKLLFSDGGHAVYLQKQDSTAYALFYAGTDYAGLPTNDIFELVYFTTDQLTALTRGTGRMARYNLLCSADAPQAHEYTMMRVVCPEIMLSRYPYAATTRPFVIEIHDPFLDTMYNLEVLPSHDMSVVRSVDGSPDLIVEISDLAQLLTGTYRADQFPQAQHIFRRFSSCYFDTY